MASFSLTGSWASSTVALNTAVQYTLVVDPSDTSTNTIVNVYLPNGITSPSATVDGSPVAYNAGQISLGTITTTKTLVISASATDGGIQTIRTVVTASGYTTAENHKSITVTPVPIDIGATGRYSEFISDPNPPNILDLNKLKANSFSFASSTGNWIIQSGNAIIERSTANQKFADISALNITSGGGDIVLSSDAYSIGDDWNQRNANAGAWFYVTEDSTITIDLYVRFASQQIVHSATTYLKANRWKWISASTDTIIDSVENGYAEFRVTVQGLTADAEMFLAAPVLVSTDLIVDNSLSTEVFMRLPEYMRESDSIPTNPDFPLFRFINILFSVAGEIDFLWDWITYLPPDDGGDETLESASSMVNPDICAPSYLPWLGSLLGVSLISPLSGFTPWDNLVNVDESTTPLPLENWDQWDGTNPAVDSILDANNDTITSWSEVEEFDIESTDYEQFARWQVSTAYYGLHGGTLKAIAESAQQTLRANKNVRFVKWTSAYQGYSNNPWILVIETLASETPDASIAGQESPSLLKAVMPATPAGIQIIHRSVDLLPTGGSALYSAPPILTLDSLNYGFLDQGYAG